MASNEPSSIGDTIGGDDSSNHVTEAVQSVASTVPENSSLNPRSAAYRAVHFAAPANEEGDEEQDNWWGEVETQNFTLDHVPNVTSVFTPSLEDIIDKPHLQEETNAVEYDADFDRLHRLADRIKSTINEQRERHFSESSEISLTDYSKQEIVQDAQASVETSKEQSLDEFKEELREKRLARQAAIQSFREEIDNLKKELEKEREISRRLRNGEVIEPSVEEVPQNKSLPASLENHKNISLKESTPEGASALLQTASSSDEDDEDPLSRSRHANIELANAQLSLQMANSENISLRGELAVVQKHVGTLKEVVACCKQMLSVKEDQCNQLKDRLTEIEKAFAEHEMKIMSDNLRQEYERQLVNIRQLRQLYEERQRVAAAEYENLQRLISIKRDELSQEQEKNKNLEEGNADLVKKIDKANNELECLRDECKEHKFEKSSLREEIGAVNTLFSQMVMGFNGKNNLDIDRLTTMLEENRTLLNDMATKEFTDGATLPKLLFELVQQASADNGKKSSPCNGAPSSSSSSTLSAKDEEEQDATKPKNTAANNDNNDNDDDVESSTSQVDEDDNVDAEAIDNENMAVDGSDTNVELATPVEMATMTTTTTTTIPTTLQQQENVDVNVDVVDATASPAAAIADSASSVPAAFTNEKVIVSSTCLTAKSKKLHHHHHHHRKAAGCKKSTASSASNGTATAAASGAGGTLQFNDPEVIGKVTSAQEIIGNLPKVWRVLMELLSHHQIDPVQFEENGKGEDCYKSVETPTGPKAELSVSKTYLKLKDLILEKKSLVKETNHLKTLNSHLDYRLNEQEKRLSAVSLELTKTWHLVGKLQRQHRQLHTQEQILRYQLQQKRRLLHELKDELENCRRKWQAARAKNDESQEQCNDLRREFARRKLEDASNSAESGYSDSGGQVSDEEVLEVVNKGFALDVLCHNENIEKDCSSLRRASGMSDAAAGGCMNFRRKRLREHFEHTRKIKRMQSTSPGRVNNGQDEGRDDIMVLRWNSAPPTCGWRDGVGGGNSEVEIYDSDEDEDTMPRPSGTIPKALDRVSRRPKRHNIDVIDGPQNDPAEPAAAASAETSDDRAARIQRLEQQCKNLIQQVLETTDNRERLEVQLKRFQDEMSPVQYAVPLDELINKKRFERMTRASSVPVTGSGTLTPREEEYTRKRSERLGRLEEESRQLMFRIKRTSDRGHYLRCSLDRIRRAPLSRDGSFESNTEEEVKKPQEDQEQDGDHISSNVLTEDGPCSLTSPSNSPLTAEEEAYTARRSARLQRLEEESKELLSSLSRNNTRGTSLGSRLDTLHERHGSQPAGEVLTAQGQQPTTSSNPSISGSNSERLTTEQRIENIEKISSKREERLRILEEEGRQLINRLNVTSEKSTQMINRIAERELSRQNRSTPQRETREPLASDDNRSGTSALLPPLKNVACTSIVSEELTDCVTITTTPSQIAANKGAIPKTKPTLQLLASRPKSARIRSSAANDKSQNDCESLEEMVKRLQALPFPKDDNKTEQKMDEKDQERPQMPTEQATELQCNYEDMKDKAPIAKLDHPELPADKEIQAAAEQAISEDHDAASKHD